MEETNKEILQKSCSLAFENDLTICHLNAEKINDEKKRSQKVTKWVKKMWSHTSKNGLFITVWPGNATQKAFVGIALNKAEIND